MSRLALLRGSRLASQKHVPYGNKGSLNIALSSIVAQSLLHKRCSSSSGTSTVEETTQTTSTSEDDKSRDKNKRSLPRKVEKDTKETSSLPPDLNILWSLDSPSRASASLPPKDLLDEALDNLLVCLHPQLQRQAQSATHLGPPVEPSLALYCPIEGGDYVLDETVRELGRLTGADVLVLDALQLVGGQWGIFGKGEPFRVSEIIYISNLFQLILWTYPSIPSTFIVHFNAHPPASMRTKKRTRRRLKCRSISHNRIQ